MQSGYFDPKIFDVGGFYIGNRDLRKAIIHQVTPALTLCEVDVFNEIKEQIYINAHNKADPKDYVKISTKVLAGELKYSERAVQTALSKLIQKKLVLQVRGIGRNASTYSLNRDYILELLQEYQKLK